VKYSVVTFGCRVNQADSLNIEADFLSRGAAAVPVEEADVVVVNTCSVTASADQAARQTIRRIGRVNPSAKIVVTGCYATRQPAEVADLPRVIAVVENDRKSALLTLALEGLTTAERFGAGDGACGAAVAPGVAGRTAFTLRVQTGCAEPCSYCIIPKTRGEPRSVPIERVLDDVRCAADAGFKEVAITGVHLGAYGIDLNPPATLTLLLRRLAEDVHGRCATDVLFRISSLEPMDCTPEVVDLVAGAGCYAPHFHLPLQHASNRTLGAMARPYTIEYYSRLVERIRQRLPHASIGTDIIVGFPGEQEDDFNALVTYLRSSPLTHLHVFPYSDRPGTIAAARRDKVGGAIVRDRARIVREAGLKLSADFRRGQIGTVHRALTIDDGTVAVTGNYLKVKIPPGRRRNEWIDLRIASEHEGDLLAG
jgi:threonylcarbamoyladenosine tRNA methylthiotransferase MtaB